MEDRLKFTDRVEDIPRIPRKLKKGGIWKEQKRSTHTVPLPKRDDER
jgi:hypothetical protein